MNTITVRDDEWWGIEGTKVPKNFKDVHEDLRTFQKKGPGIFFWIFAIVVGLPYLVCLYFNVSSGDYLALLGIPAIAITAYAVFQMIDAQNYELRYMSYVYKACPREKVKGTIDLWYGGNTGVFRKRDFYTYLINLPGRHPTQYKCFSIVKDGVQLPWATDRPVFSGREMEMDLYIDPLNKVATAVETPDGYRLWLEPKRVAEYADTPKDQLGTSG